MEITTTINPATNANIKGSKDLSNCVKNNVSLALAPVILDPTIQKNIIINRMIGETSSFFIFIIDIIYTQAKSYKIL